MSIVSFVEELESNQIYISLQEEQLKVIASKEKITSEMVTRIRSQKPELIAYLKDREPVRRADGPLLKAHRRSNFDLSHAQKRLWVISQLEATRSAYNIIQLRSVDIEFDQAAFTEAFHLLSHRHETLRTVFKATSGMPEQVVYPAGTLQPYVEFVDLSDSADPTSEVEGYQDREFHHCFDLIEGPLLRVHVLRLASDHTKVLINIHHIVADGWSIKVLEEEFFQLYEGLIEGEKPRLKPLPLQYIDYTIWQNEQVKSGALDRSRKYWHQCFEGEIPALELATERPRPSQKTYAGKSLSFVIPKNETDALSKLCGEQGGTLFMGLLGLVNTLLYRYTGQTDTVIGSPIAGRNQLELENQIGFYANTLPLRTQFSGDVTFLELLDRVMKTTFDAYDHQDYPFDLLVEELGLDVDLSRNPLFDMMLILQSQRVEKAQGWESDYLELDEDEISKFDLTLNFIETTAGMLTHLTYNRDLFSDDRMKGMVQHLKNLLSSILDNPNAPISSCRYLTPKEEKTLLRDFQGPVLQLPESTTVIDLFFDQVEKRPEAIALKHESKEWTYQELDQLTSHVASVLREDHQVIPGDMVGLRLDRNEAFVISMLATFKCGAAFLPIPISYPADRVDHLLEDSGARVLVLEEALPALDFQAVVTYESLQEAKADDTPFKPQTEANGRAYVIYTSGSTGKPKGVIVGQEALLSFCLSANKIFDIQPSSNSAMYNSIGFDASVWDIWPYLIAGAAVVTVPEAIRLDTKKLATFYRQEGVTHSFLTTAFCEQLQEEPQLPESLVLMTGGERMRKVTPNPAQLYHNYGPTEATVIVTSTPLDDVNPDPDLPIGKPLPNIEILLLDDQHSLVPVGVKGQIAIGGTQLADGYLNAPELTATKFIDHPYHAGKKLYLTGDLGRWRPDGQLVFEGRLDHQVKVRGYRIELGEIENALRVLPEVDRALVQVIERNGDKSIVAYYTGEQVAMDLLQSTLKQQLPYYMIPSIFMYLEAFPLNANNKIDLKQLPEPIIQRSQNEGEEGTIIEQEEQLLDIWKEFLQVPSIGVHENFFDLGGHSLKAVKIISKVYQVFGAEITLKDLFEYPTVRTLVEARLLNPETSQQQLSSVDEEDIDLTDCYELSFAQRRLWLLSQFDFAKNAYKTVRRYALGKANPQWVEAVWHQLVERHESLRTSFVKVKGKPYQKIHPFIRESYPLNLLETNGDETQIHDIRSNLIAEEFDLQKGPLVKASLVVDDKGESTLLLVIHPIIADNKSLDLLVEEFAVCYQHLSVGKHDRLPPWPQQYKDYSDQQHALKANGVWDHHLDYWKEVLKGPLPLLQLPADNSRPPLKTYQGETLRFSLDQTLSQNLKTYCQQQEVTLEEGLVAVTNVLLARLANKSDLIVGVPILNRELPAYERQIGFYENTLVVRHTFDLSDSFDTLLALVRENIRTAQQHREYPFDLLIEELDLPRDFSRNPIFDVMVAHQSLEEGSMIVPEADEFILLENELSKLDLTFTYSEIGEVIVCDLNFNTDLIYTSRARRLAGQLKAICEAVVANPGSPIHQVNLLPDSELALIYSFNQTDLDFNREETTVQWIERALDHKPEAVAIIDDQGNQLTYGQLQEKVNQWAHFLRKTYRIQKDQLIGLMVDRSVDMVILMLAIQRSGAAYVPIDKQYPQERIDYIIDNSDMRVLLTDQAYQVEDCPVLLIKDCSNEVSTHPVTPLLHVNSVGDRSHLIYTSGSTGKPKGVEIEHRNVTAFLAWCLSEFEKTAYDRVLAVTSYCFDLSIFEIFYHLYRGVPIHLLESGTEIPKHVHEGDKVLINTVPSVVEFLIREQMDWSQVAALNMAGEPISDFVFRHLEYQDLEVRNLYGPSEDTTYSTWYQLDGHEDPIPIGKPIANTRVYVLDDHQQQQPVGVIGEITIAGEGLARGYIHNPEATDAKFIANPFEEHGRLYLTGDLGQWSEDGVLLYEGRKDFQVKIRGFRIELGEIEKAMLAFDGISTAVVNTFQPAGEKHLVAYHDGADLEIQSLKNHLKLKLPYYMIPAYYMYLEEFPLNANGKLDRKALPLPDSDGDDTQTRDMVKGPVQQALHKIWAEVLGHRKFGPKEVFFELGGHSLKAMQAVTRMITTLQVDITLPEFFENPTIEALAELVQAKNTSKTAAISPLPEKEFYEVSNAQRRLWVIEQFETSEGVYNIPIQYNLDEINLDVFKAAWLELIERHEALRTVFVMHQGQLRQKIQEVHELGEVIEVQDRQDASEEALYRDLTTLFGYSFDLKSGPLFKAVLFKLGPDRYKFAFVIHHIICDGWSMSVLERDLMQIYEDLMDGKASSLKPLLIQYKDYSGWQNQQLYSGMWSSHRAWWLSTLKGELPVLQLPGDYPRPARKTHHGATIKMLLAEDISNALEAYCKANNATLFMGLTTLCTVLLHKYTAQDDIILGSPIAGRHHQGLEDQIGFYVNTVALRNKIQPDQTFGQLFAQVKDMVLQTYSHQDYPFDMLAEELDLSRDMSRSPIFDVMISQPDFHDKAEVIWEGEPDEIYLEEEDVAKYDLTFTFVQGSSGLTCEFNYNQEIYSEARIRHMAQVFRQMSAELLAAPAQLLEQVQLLSTEEQERLIHRPEVASYYQEKDLLSRWDEEVLAHPLRQALIDGTKEWSYDLIDLKTNEIANYFLSLIPDEGDFTIGIHLEKSTWFALVVLGAMKADVRHVLISSEDLNHPWVAEGVNLLITDKHLEEGLDLPLMDVQMLDEKLASIPSTPLQHAHSLPLILKEGIEMPIEIYQDSAIQNAVKFILEKCTSDKDFNRIYWSFPTQKYLGITQLLATLLAGQTLVIGEEKEMVDPDSFVKNLSEHGAEVFCTTTYFLNSLIESLSGQSMRLADVHSVLVTDGVVTEELKERFYAVFPETTRLLNVVGEQDLVFGPYVLYKEISAQIIGHLTTLDGYELRVVDASGNPVPAGIPGCLLISNMSGTTAHSMVMHSRRAQFSFTHELEYLGSESDVLTISGNVIDRSLIEGELMRHKQVREILVLPGQADGFDLLYVGSGLGNTIIRQLLSERFSLAHTSIQIIKVDRMRYLSGGQPDASTLLRSGEQNVETDQVETTTELMLLDIWEEVLGRNQIGAEESFFDLGGQSLKATQIVTRVQHQFEVELRIAEVYNNPTIKALAFLIDHKQTAGVEMSQTCIIQLGKRKSGKTSLFLVPPVAGSSTVFQDLVNLLESDYNCFGFQYPGFEKGDAIASSLQAMSEKFVAEIFQDFTKEQPVVLLGYSMGGLISFEMAKLLEAKGWKVKLILLDKNVPDPLQDVILDQEEIEQQAVFQEVSHWLEQMRVEEVAYFKEFFTNNIKISMQHEIVGMLNADVLALEASNNEVRTEMQHWQTHTRGKVIHHYLEAQHLEVLDASHLNTVFEHIKSFSEAH